MSDIRHRVLTATHITEFLRRVYLELLRVPRGKTITYGELARRIGCRSAQAVGQALKRNPFAPKCPATASLPPMAPSAAFMANAWER
jgi:O6-methylguanine-DNA--protein-cysteine methyltransferase